MTRRALTDKEDVNKDKEHVKSNKENVYKYGSVKLKLNYLDPRLEYG